MKKNILVLPLLATLIFALPNSTHAGRCEGVELLSNPQYVEITSAVFLRVKACDGDALTTLPAGAIVEVKGTIDNEWYYLEYEGNLGYVYESFVRPVANPEITPAPEEQEPLWDVEEDDPYAGAIWNLYTQGVVTGNGTDGSYQSMSSINRAEFTTIIARANYDQIPKSEKGCLSDVSSGLWYSDPVCLLHETFANGIRVIEGNPGGKFDATDNIQFSAAAKILALVYGLEVGESDTWYHGPIQALSDAYAIPPSINDPSDLVNKGEMAEMIDRLMRKDISQPSTQFNYTVQMPSQETENEEQPSEAEEDLDLCVMGGAPLHIDYSVLKEKALELTNEARGEKGLDPLTQSDILDATSMLWALNGEFTHERPNGLDLVGHQESLGVTQLSSMAENLGQASLSCNNEDCTDQAVNALEVIHQLFLDEEKNPEGQRAHFDNIMGDYETMGFGFSHQNGNLLLVFHYGTGFQADADQLCLNLQ